jgi:condensin-2 complex subunit D3
MLQKLATSKGLEKAASRSLTVKTLHKCVEHLPSLERSLFLEFLLQLCRSKLKIHRLVGSELVGRILTEEWLWTEHIHESAPTPASTPAAKRLSISPFRIKNSQNLPVSFLLALQDRLVDRLPTVRAASANALAGIFSKVLEANENKAVGSSVALGAIMDAIAEEADDLLDCLRDRAVSDEKATVRRAAVGALVGLLVAGESSSDEDVQSAARITFSDAETLGELCLKDSSIQTRQAAAEGLTRILECCVESGDRSYSLSKIEKAWSLSTLTMVLDSENSCASKAKQLVERVVLYPILEDAEDEHTQLAWRVLATLVGGPGSKSETTSLRVVVAKNLAENNDSLSKLFKIIHRVAIRNLEEIAEDTFFQPSVENQRNGAWSLFEAVVGHAKDQSQLSRVIKRSKVDLGFLSASWDMMLNVFTSPETPSESKPALQRSMCKCLLVISKLSSHLDDVLAINVATDLKKMLGDLSLPVEIIGSAVTAMVATTVASAAHGTSENDVKQRCATHIQSLFQDCENEIAEHVGKSIAKEDETTLGRAFSTVGNISMLGYSSGDDGSRIVDDKQSPENVLRGLRVKPSMRLVELVQAFMADTVPGLKTSSTPVSVRAHALVTLGKFCLRDERLAKSALNILSRELHNQVWREGNSVTIQSNALLILGDLCVAYTNLVDRFLPVMAACLQAGVTDWDAGLLAPSKHNGSALVRKHAVVLLSNLLLQDYIKWRGLLFHRFLVASMDEDEDVAELAETALCGPLMVKQPKLFSMNFVESLFVLNRCTAHPIHDAASAMGDGGSGISVGFEGINLTGDLGRARRMSMYELMLSKMSDEDKIGVTARIAKEVLAGSLDHGNDLHLVCTSENLLSCTDSKSTFESSFNVMSDAFAILSSPCIRVGKSAQVEEDIEDPDLPNANNKRVLVSRGRLLSKISRKQMIETLLPILCNLKAVLQKSRSPLLKDLMRCLVDVFRRFNSEVKECLASDPTLLQEIAYDAQQFKKIGEGDNVLMLSHVKA